MGKILGFANQKGGVGKTTSCVNLGASLVALKQRVLIVDLDPQGNATMGSGVDKNALEYTINEVLLGQAKIEQALITETEGGYALLPANGHLTEAEVSLLAQSRYEAQLKKILAPLKARYDFIFIDCPPSLNALTLNALVAAQGVIIPMQCEYYALEGLSALINTIEQIQNINPGLQIEGVVRTMYDPRSLLAKEVEQQLRRHFAKQLYKTIIPRNIRIAEAPSFGVPVLLHDARSAGAQAYMSLAREFLRKTKLAKSPALGRKAGRLASRGARQQKRRRVLSRV